jgi:hypothetical protein
MKADYHKATAGSMGDLPPEYAEAAPMALESPVQESLQPDVVQGQEPQESEQPPNRFSGLTYEELQSLMTPRDREVAPEEESVYKQISQKLLDELNNDKVNWGEAMGLAAVAYDNPQLAYQMLESKANRKERVKSLLMQAAGQEVALKRGEQAAERQSARQDAIARENELKSIRLSGSQERARAEAAQVDISDIDLSNPETFYDNLPKAQSRIALGAQLKSLKQVAAQNDIPIDDIDTAKPSQEAIDALQSRIGDEQKDIQTYNTAVKVGSASPTGLTPKAIESLTSTIKNPQRRLEAQTILDAAMREGEIRRRQTELQMASIQDQMDARAERLRISKTAAETREALAKATADAKTMAQADAAVGAAEDNIRQANTEEDLVLARLAWTAAVQKRDKLKGELNPFSGKPAEALDLVYRAYIPTEDSPTVLGNKTFTSQENLDAFLFDPANQQDEDWQTGFEAMWRDFDIENNDLGEPLLFILQFNQKAAEWAAAKTESNWWGVQAPLSVPHTAIPNTPEMLKNPAPEPASPPQ